PGRKGQESQGDKGIEIHSHLCELPDRLADAIRDVDKNRPDGCPDKHLSALRSRRGGALHNKSQPQGIPRKRILPPPGPFQTPHRKRSGHDPTDGERRLGTPAAQGHGNVRLKAGVDRTSSLVRTLSGPPSPSRSTSATF